MLNKHDVYLDIFQSLASVVHGTLFLAQNDFSHNFYSKIKADVMQPCYSFFLTNMFRETMGVSEPFGHSQDVILSMHKSSAAGILRQYYYHVWWHECCNIPASPCRHGAFIRHCDTNIPLLCQQWCVFLKNAFSRSRSMRSWPHQNLGEVALIRKIQLYVTNFCSNFLILQCQNIL